MDVATLPVLAVRRAGENRKRENTLFGGFKGQHSSSVKGIRATEGTKEPREEIECKAKNHGEYMSTYLHVFSIQCGRYMCTLKYLNSLLYV